MPQWVKNTQSLPESLGKKIEPQISIRKVGAVTTQQQCLVSRAFFLAGRKLCATEHGIMSVQNIGNE
jgi:hypothetical protein